MTCRAASRAGGRGRAGDEQGVAGLADSSAGRRRARGPCRRRRSTSPSGPAAGSGPRPGCRSRARAVAVVRHADGLGRRRSSTPRRSRIVRSYSSRVSRRAGGGPGSRPRGRRSRPGDRRPEPARPPARAARAATSGSPAGGISSVSTCSTTSRQSLPPAADRRLVGRAFEKSTPALGLARPVALDAMPGQERPDLGREPSPGRARPPRQTDTGPPGSRSGPGDPAIDPALPQSPSQAPPPARVTSGLPPLGFVSPGLD